LLKLVILNICKETLSGILFLFIFAYKSLLSGKTREVENSQFQQEPLSVFVYYTPLPVEGLELNEDETTRIYLFVTSIDEKQSTAKESFDYGKSSINVH
jgi:hypothetical protein